MAKTLGDIFNGKDGDVSAYFASRNRTIGNQDIEIILGASGSLGEETGRVLIDAIDDVLSRLVVTQTGAEVITK